jgi:hypothetical protein
MAANVFRDKMLPMNIACHVEQSTVGFRVSGNDEQLSKTDIESVGRRRLPRRQGILRRDKCLNLYGDYVEK